MGNRRIKHPRVMIANLLRELEQTIVDFESWNTNRTDAPPMDIEFERVMAAKCRKMLAVWDRGDREEYRRLSEDLATYAEQEVGRG